MEHRKNILYTASSSPNTRICLGIISILFFVYAFYIFSFTAQKTRMPDINEIIKLTLAHSYYYGYTDEHIARNKDFYPPVYFYLSALVCRLLFGRFSFQGVVVGNIFYILITILAVYFIILKLCGRGLSALCGVLIFLSLPGTVYFAPLYVAEVSVMAAVSLCLCIYIYSSYFKNRFACFLLGLGMAFGMLCKWTFVIYVFLPLAFAVGSTLMHKDKERIRNIGITLLVFFAGSLWWYLSSFNIDKIVFSFYDSLQMECAKIEQGYFAFLAENLKRTSFLFKEVLSPGLVFLFFIILLVFLVKGKGFGYKAIWLWLFIPIIIYIFLPTNCVSRYLLPILPVTAAVMTIGIWLLDKKIIRLLLILLLLLFSVAGSPFWSAGKRDRIDYTGSNFLTYVLVDARNHNIISPLIGLDAFHDPKHIVQDLYYTLWFLRLRDNHSFHLFYRDIEMIQASRRDYFKKYYDEFFKEYHQDFLNCDYLISAQQWDGWLKDFQPLASIDVVLKDDVDRLTYARRYYLYRKQKAQGRFENK